MSLYTNIQALWRVNNDWLDSSGNSNDGSASGATFDAVNQKLGSACGDFDGVDDVVSFGNDSSILITGNMTTNIWAKHTTLAQNGILLLCMDAGASDNRPYQIVALTNGKIQVNQRASGQATESVISIGTVDDDAWHMITFVRDATDMSLYIDGSFDNSNPFTHTPTIGNAELTMGANTVPSAEYLGLLDECAIWDADSSTSKITRLWNGGKGLEIGRSILRRRMEGY